MPETIKLMSDIMKNKKVAESLETFITKEGFTDRKYIRLPKGSDEQLKEVSTILNLPENVIIGFATFLFIIWLLDELGKS